MFVQIYTIERKGIYLIFMIYFVNVDSETLVSQARMCVRACMQVLIFSFGHM